jgi:hypothetical protein
MAGNPVNFQGYLMGGHVDENDHHGTAFDETSLTALMQQAGLTDITYWKDDVLDCSSLPVSLNLQGVKPQRSDGQWTEQQQRQFEDSVKIRAHVTHAIMSMPRLAFTDNYFSALGAFPPLGIQLRKHTGAFWGQCLERGIEQAIDEGARYVITVDYDSIYTRDDVLALLALSVKYPDVDAIAPIQAARTKATPMFTIRGGDGVNVSKLDRSAFEPDLMDVHTAHFGLTLLKVDALKELPKPWFQGLPNPNTGQWDDGRTDDDIHLWRLFHKHGKRLCLANRIPIGHAELMIRWPDVNLEAMHQHPSEYWETGKPEQSWK